MKRNDSQMLQATQTSSPYRKRREKLQTRITTGLLITLSPFPDQPTHLVAQPPS